jgi:CxxC motif-containing protein (DUF1111 family)
MRGDIPAAAARRSIVKNRRWLLCALLLVALSPFVPLRTLTAQLAPQFGDPLPDLAPDGLGLAFHFGKEKFMQVQTPETGLGPVYNGKSCVECHSNPVPGGSGASLENRVIRFAKQVQGEPFDPLLNLGGPNLQKSSVADELPGCSLAAEVVPPEANVTGIRQPPQLFGLGLIEAIPDSTILTNADPTDANGDGIAGRPNISNGVLGRFGWKAAVPTLLNFIGLAMVNELGVTNYLFPNEMLPQGQPIPTGCKITGDPEDVGAPRLSGLLFFTTYLGPPPRGPITDAVLRGEAVFTQIACTHCHTPSMKTGPNAIEALNEKDVPLYSDLLTHYMGGALDDHLIEGAVGGGRWRTAPLWGLRARKFFLHDGRTSELAAAIGLHGGEASGVRAQFVALPPNQKADLIVFLRSL